PKRAITIEYENDRVVRVAWSLPAGGKLRQVTLYEQTDETGSCVPRRTRCVRVVPAKMVGGRLCCLLGELPPHRSCNIVAEAAVDNGHDLRVIVRSKPIRLETPAPRAAGRETD